MKALLGLVFLVAIGSVMLFAVARLLRLVLGAKSAKGQMDDASDVADAAKVGLGALGVATFFLAPTGIMSILVGLKLASKPTLIAIAPGLAMVFGGLALVGTAGKIYARRKAQRR